MLWPIKLQRVAYPGFVETEAYTIFGALFKKNNIKLRIKNKYESEYLFRMRKLWI